jgi:hypothetical protein
MKTPMQWLLSQINKEDNITHSKIDQLAEIALQMEKLEIKTAYDRAQTRLLLEDIIKNTVKQTSEEYFNKTYQQQ